MRIIATPQTIVIMAHAPCGGASQSPVSRTAIWDIDEDGEVWARDGDLSDGAMERVMDALMLPGGRMRYIDTRATDIRPVARALRLSRSRALRAR